MGNILAVITDRKVPNVNGSNYNYFNAQITSMTDYYPFGMQIEERSWTASGYRFGFNGQEKDNEVSGEGNSYTAEFWQYDVRIARRSNIDPVVVYHESGYAVFRNSPISFSDPNGDVPTNGDPINRTSVNTGFTFTMNLGKTGGLNLSAYVGASLATPYMTWGFNASGNLYAGNGTPGTSEVSRFLADITLSPSVTVGYGGGASRPLNTFHSFAGTGVFTSQATSFSFGQNFTFSTREFASVVPGYNRMQRTSFAGLRIADFFSAGSINDVERFPFMGDSRDEHWSASINAGFHLKSGFSIFWLTDMYYGNSNHLATSKEDDWINGVNYDNQSFFDRLLNSPMETINVFFPRGAFYGMGEQVMLGFGRTGERAMWPSNNMHKNIPDPITKGHHFHYLQVLRDTRPVIRHSINYYINLMTGGF